MQNLCQLPFLMLAEALQSCLIMQGFKFLDNIYNTIIHDVIRLIEQLQTRQRQIIAYRKLLELLLYLSLNTN